jgi:hypothetical protein
MRLEGSLWRSIIQDDFVGNIDDMHTPKIEPPKRAVSRLLLAICHSPLVEWQIATSGGNMRFYRETRGQETKERLDATELLT